MTADDHAAKCLWEARRGAERMLLFFGRRSCGSYPAGELLRSAVERQSLLVLAARQPAEAGKSLHALSTPGGPPGPGDEPPQRP